MLTYDMPLWRPPSEGDNLIIQATIEVEFRARFGEPFEPRDDAGTLPRDLDALPATLDAARAGAVALRPRHLREH